MSNLLALKNRQKTIKSLNSLMNAMLVITAANIQKIKAKYYHLLKYYVEIEEILKNVVSSQETASNKCLVIVIGTDRGLCGNFNDKVIGTVKEFISERKNECEFILLGKNTCRLKNDAINILHENCVDLRDLFLGALAKIVQDVYSWRLRSSGSVYMAYNEYKSILVQNPKITKIFPCEKKAESDYLLEPNPSDLVEPALKQYLLTAIIRYIAESQVGELNSRMLLVKGAADSSKDLLYGLRIEINKTRQADITSELSEIVSSFETLGEAE